MVVSSFDRQFAVRHWSLGSGGFDFDLLSWMLRLGFLSRKKICYLETYWMISSLFLIVGKECYYCNNNNITHTQKKCAILQYYT